MRWREVGRPVDVRLGDGERPIPMASSAGTSPRTGRRRWRWRCRARRRRDRRGDRGDGGHGAGAVTGGVAYGVAATSGRRRASRARRPRRRGPAGSCRAPRPRRSPRSADSSPGGLRAPGPATAAMPTPSRTSPRSGERRLVAVTATPGQDRDDVLAEAIQPGTTAARKALATRTPRRARVPTGHLERAPTRCRRSAARPAAGPSRREAEHHPDDRGQTPSTSPAARMTRRACFGVPPLAAIRARVRDCRRAPTANAGPASSTTSRRAITTIRTSAAITASSVGPSTAGTRRGARSRGRVLHHRARQHQRADRVERHHLVHVTGPPPISQVSTPSVVSSRGARRPEGPREASASSSTRRCRRRSVARRQGQLGADVEPLSARASLTVTSCGPSARGRRSGGTARPEGRGGSSSVARRRVTPRSVSTGRGRRPAAWRGRRGRASR